jgi:hypothetical protein
MSVSTLDDYEEEDGEVALEKWKGYYVGDCVSYKVDDLKNVEAQGVIFSIVKEGENVWFELNLMKRAPPTPLWDVVGPKMNAFRYVDLDEIEWINYSQVLCEVHLEFIQGQKKKLNRGFLMDSVDSQRRKCMMYYQDGPGGEPGVSMQMKLSWYHFDKEWLANLDWNSKRCLAIDDADLTLGFLNTLKPVLFDPFVSACSYTHRHKQPHWNIRTWKLLLRATQDKNIQLDYELEQLQIPRRDDMIKKEEIFIGPVRGIGILKFIFVLLKEWMKLNPRKTSIYCVMQYLEHHRKIMEGIVRKIASRVSAQADKEESTDSEASDLDEHESFGFASDMEDDDNDEEEGKASVTAVLPANKTAGDGDREVDILDDEDEYDSFSTSDDDDDGDISSLNDDSTSE